MLGSYGGFVGWAFKIAFPDGSYVRLANGLRSPAGLGVDPEGRIWYAEIKANLLAAQRFLNYNQENSHGHPASLL